MGNFVGSDGLAITNLATPVYFFYALVGVTLGVGANMLIRRFLGEGNVKEANRLFSSLLTIGLCCALICLLPLLFRKTYYSFLGVTDQLYDLADRYLRLVLWTAPVFVVCHILSSSVQTDGDPLLAAISSAVVIVFNLVFDFVFIKGLDMGILGASASLCMAEVVGTLVLLCHFFKKNKILKLRLSIPKLKDIGQFIWNGFSSGSIFIFAAIVMLVFNNLLLKFGGSDGTTFVALYGVIYTVSTIPSAFYDGSSSALATVTPFLVGESDVKGIKLVLKRALFVALLAATIFVIIGVSFSSNIVYLFGINDERGVSALRIFMLSLVPMGVNAIVVSYWQAIGRVKIANAVTTLRSCVFILAAGFIFIPIMDIKGVSLSYFVAESLILLVVLVIYLIAPSKKKVLPNFQSEEPSFEKNYWIEEKNISQMTEDLEKVCEEWEIDPKKAFLINFVGEEIILNIMNHVLKEIKGKKRYYICVKLLQNGDDYTLIVKDNVWIFNPLEERGDLASIGASNLIKKKAKSYDYQRKLIFNYLYINL